jgi:hypothetical protein
LRGGLRSRRGGGSSGHPLRDALSQLAVLLADDRKGALIGVGNLKATLEKSNGPEDHGQHSERRPEKPAATHGLAELCRPRRGSGGGIVDAEE